MLDMEQLVKEYQPTLEVRRLVETNPPVLFVGVSGAGKNTIINQLLTTGGYHDLITCTTRPPRDNDGVMERDGIDYYFLSDERARQMIEQQEFIEVKLVHGTTIYGSSVAEYQKAVMASKTPIADVDVQGAMEYKNMAVNSVALFVLPPSYEVWLERLKKRFDNEVEFLAVWPKRRESAIKELEIALESQQFEWVVNDDLSDAVNEVKRLIASPGSDFATKSQKQLARDLLAKLKVE